MKRVRFRDPAGAVRRGTWHDDTVRFGDSEYDAKAVEILPPTEPTKVVCVGLNYADHAEERGDPRPDRPRLFVKTPNTVAGHGDTVTLPPNKELIEFEGELGVVVGEQCRDVPAAEALSVVEGFTPVDDLSNRDDQLPEQNNVRAKCFDGALPFGPVVADPEAVPEDATLRTLVNGNLHQETTRDAMRYSVPEVIEAVTAFMTLEPGDLIATGTPSGTANLADGDRITVEIEGVGALSHHVARPA